MKKLFLFRENKGKKVERNEANISIDKKNWNSKLWEREESIAKGH